MVHDRRATENPFEYLRPIPLAESGAFPGRLNRLRFRPFLRPLRPLGHDLAWRGINGPSFTASLLRPASVPESFGPCEWPHLTSGLRVTVEGKDTKNRRTATLPLRGGTASMLRHLGQ